MTVTEFTGEVHPVADLFPMLAEDELADLAEDIAERGLLQPIVLDAEGRLLDGRNRLAACEKAGVEPTFVVFDGGDPDGYALTVNITRRHLTTGARAVLAEQARRLNGSTRKGTARGTDLYPQRLIEAGDVLDWAPALAPAVVAGATPLSKAVEQAREAKRDAEALQAKLDRLSADGPDLRDLVDEGRMSADDAIAVLNARVTKAEQEAELERQERESAIRRHQERLHSLVNGWVEIPGLSDNPLRDDILAGLTPSDRQAVLDIEAIYKKASMG